jgi:biopolymer transport protein TolR
MLAKNLKRKRYRPMAEINVVPYIDVMLVLLVIFMITAPLLTQGVKVDLPKTRAEILAPKQLEPIIISVDARGNYYLNIAANPNLPLAAEALSSQVAAALNQTKNTGTTRAVLVKGDQKVNYGAVVQVMVLLKAAGAPNVGLMTDPLRNNE